MKIVLGGIVKNIEPFFSSVATFIDALKQEIPCLEVCLYENNSSDHTKELLQQLNPDFITIQCEDYTNDYFLDTGYARTWDNQPCRIQMIAHARNKLLDMIHTKNLTPGDFVILSDLDFLKSPDPVVIAKILTEFPAGVAAIFANGVVSNGKYYDASVLRTDTFPFGPEILGEIFWEKHYLDQIQCIITQPMKVYSAFGGLGIYRAEAITGCRYSETITDDVHALYTKLNAADYTRKQFEAVQGDREAITHYKGVLRGCFLKDNKIFYKHNSGYAWPILGEHVPFHAAMIQRGWSHMYILPELKYYYPF